LSRAADLRRDPRAGILLALLFATALYPLLLRSDYALGAAITVGTMAIASVGFVLLLGYARQLAIGQAAFCTIGGYGSALLVIRAQWDPFVAMIAAMGVSMTVAYLVGRPILKLHGFVLAMASLALQLILGFVATDWSELTGGAIGLSGVPRFAILGWKVGGDRELFYVVWCAVALAVLAGLNIDRSRIGRELRAIASSERAASSVGIDLGHAKVQMFVLSAGMASVAGSLTVHYLRLMEPSIFGFQYSLNIITAVVIGGLGSIWGGVLGAGIIIGLREALRLTSQPLFEGVVMGALTIIILLLFPRGVAGGIADLYRIATRRDSDSAEMRVAAASSGSFQDLTRDDTILILDRVARRFGNLVAVDTVSFTVARGSITALIGPNGAGKTTLFNMISGDQPLNGGEIRFDGIRIDRLSPHRVARRGIARTFQNLELFDTMTVMENVMCGRTRHAGTNIAAIVARLPGVGREERKMREEAQRWLAFVGLGGAGARPPNTLAFGHQRLVELARALALEPNLLLLDEPASGLNDSETEQLADLILRIRATGVTILLVEHDIRLVMGLADHIVVMNYGKKIAEGAPTMVRTDKQVLSAYLGG
jgi:branched-chain amino acid transport system permease protein